MATYRAPFLEPDSRRPIWRFANELPIAGQPADVYATLTRAHAALAASAYSKLLFVGTPGALVSPEYADRFAGTLRDCSVVHLGPGAHYLQEDHAPVIGQSVAAWIDRVEAVPRSVYRATRTHSTLRQTRSSSTRSPSVKVQCPTSTKP